MDFVRDCRPVAVGFPIKLQCIRSTMRRPSLKMSEEVPSRKEVLDKADQVIDSAVQMYEALFEKRANAADSVDEQEIDELLRTSYQTLTLAKELKEDVNQKMVSDHKKKFLAWASGRRSGITARPPNVAAGGTGFGTIVAVQALRALGSVQELAARSDMNIRRITKTMANLEPGDVGRGANQEIDGAGIGEDDTMDDDMPALEECSGESDRDDEDPNPSL